MRFRFASVVGICSFVAACGSRSDLSIDETFTAPDVDASVPVVDASPPKRDAADAKPPIPDTGVDAADTAPSCPAVCDDDGIACTIDGCDPKTFSCVHVPDDSRCPLGEKCDGVTGCKSIIYAVTTNALYEVSLPAGALRLISSQLPFTGDIALTKGGTLYAIGQDMESLDRVTGAVIEDKLLDTWYGDFLSLDAAPDGTLFGGISARETIAQIDPKGHTVSFVASLPSGYQGSGDIAFVGGRLFGSAKDAFKVTSDTLVEIGLNGAPSRVLGKIGVPCVWGLAGVESTLYGFTCDGRMMTIDTSTGLGTTFAKTDLVFNGATSR